MDISKIKNLIKKEKIEVIDLKFTDLKGAWQHLTIPISQFGKELFLKGVGFDGSSITGFQEIHQSDMVLVPDIKTARIDPFFELPTLSFIAEIFDPEEKKRFSRDPRFVAQKAEEYLKKEGIASESFWGPEVEFFLFNHLSYEILPHKASYEVDSLEGFWRSGENERPSASLTIRPKEGYFPVSPQDSLMDLRSRIVAALEKWGVKTEMHHHEVASGGQVEIDIQFDSLTKMADKVMIYKYVVKNVALRHNLIACFMPKPIFGDNGSGMHVHQSLWKGERNLFYDERAYAELSKLGLYYIGGVLTHIDALMGFCAPTTNSYKRLVPHYEAPVNVVFSKRNRSAAIRIPVYHWGKENAESKRIEFRPPDPSCNPYLAFAAILMAGIDGIKKKIDPVKAGFGPIDKNIYELENKETEKIKSVPSSLEESLAALKRNHGFLLEGEVFTKDVISTFVKLKKKEAKEVSIRPAPFEFYLYADV